MGDGDLLERARAGDFAAFELLLGPLIEPACHLAYTMLDDWHEAEDATQDAALRAWRSMAGLREDTTTIRPWFLTIVANQARTRRRARWHSVVRLAEPDAGAAPGLEEEVLLSVDLQRAMRRLDETERLILFLRFHLDLPLEDVARVASLSPAAAKSRIYRALHKLRPAMRCAETA